MTLSRKRRAVSSSVSMGPETSALCGGRSAAFSGADTEGRWAGVLPTPLHPDDRGMDALSVFPDIATSKGAANADIESAYGVTTICAVMCGWRPQKYSYVPSWVNVNVNLSPVSSALERN